MLAGGGCIWHKELDAVLDGAREEYFKIKRLCVELLDLFPLDL